MENMRTRRDMEEEEGFRKNKEVDVMLLMQK